MAKTGKVAEKSSREKLIERANRRFPDRKYVGEMSENGELSEAPDELEASIIEILQENDDANLKLNNLMASDPLVAEFINKWVEYGDPRAALVEMFGDDISKLATPEGKAEFSEQLNNWKTRRDEELSMATEAEANWDESLRTLDEWGASKGLDMATKAKVMARLIDITAGGLKNKYDVNDFEMVFRDQNYDSAVSAAKNEGEVAGRNARIEAEKRGRAAGNDAVPPSMSGSRGMRVPTPEPPKEKSPWADIK